MTVRPVAIKRGGGFVGWATNQLLENTIIQLHLRRTALEQAMVIILQTLEVGTELVEAVGVDILDPAK